MLEAEQRMCTTKSHQFYPIRCPVLSSAVERVLPSLLDEPSLP